MGPQVANEGREGRGWNRGVSYNFHRVGGYPLFRITDTLRGPIVRRSRDFALRSHVSGLLTLPPRPRDFTLPHGGGARRARLAERITNAKDSSGGRRHFNLLLSSILLFIGVEKEG